MFGQISALIISTVHTVTHLNVYSNHYSMEKLQFAHTRQSLLLLESVGRCVQQQEPVLLVGETGVGKTALVSYLASITGENTRINALKIATSVILAG